MSVFFFICRIFHLFVLFCSMREQDPVGVEQRKSRCLKRRSYQSGGPNFLYCDGYDKLKLIKFPIHGGIDVFSRKLIQYSLSFQLITTHNRTLNKNIPSNIKCKHRSLLMLKFIYLLKKSKRFGVIQSPSSVDKNVKFVYFHFFLSFKILFHFNFIFFFQIFFSKIYIFFMGQWKTSPHLEGK